VPNLFTNGATIKILEDKVKTRENTIEDQAKQIEKLKSIIDSFRDKLTEAGIPFPFNLDTINENINTYNESYKHCQTAADWVDLKKHNWVKQIKNLDLSDYSEQLNSESKLKSFEEDILHYLELLADSLRNTMFLDISAIKPSINSSSSKLLYKRVLTYIRDIDEFQDLSPVEVAKLKQYLNGIIKKL
jgi:hypothetical protein